MRKAMVEVPVNPYEVYIEILSHRVTLPRVAAYTGDMIAMTTEVNQLFGRTKGKIDQETWDTHTNAFIEAVVLFERTWRELAARLESGHSDPQSAELTATNFRTAVEALRATLEGMREVSARLGIVSWVY